MDDGDDFKLPNPDQEAEEVLAKIWKVTPEEARRIADREELLIARSRPVNDVREETFIERVQRERWERGDTLSPQTTKPNQSRDPDHW